MKRYEAYKESGVDWIGEIPEQWGVRRFKHVLRILGGNGFPQEAQGHEYGDYPFCKVSDINGDGWTVDKAANYVDAEWVKENRVNVVPADSILMAKIGAALTKNHRKVNLLDCCIDNNMQALLPDNRCIALKYLYWIMSTVDMSWYDAGGTLPYVDNQKFLNDSCPYPELAYQQAIADYLDAKTTEIDALVAGCEREVELLREYRKAVISEAVTKGLDPDTPMKDSGVERIGEIPEKWNTARTKQVCSKITDGSHFSPNTVDEGYPYITATNIRGRGIDYNSAKLIDEESYSQLVQNGCRPHLGDVLMVKDGATTGRAGLMIDDEPCVILSSVALLRPTPICNSDYLFYFIQSHSFQEQVLVSMAGSAMPRTTLDKLVEYYIVVPPIPDQIAITAHLDAKTAEVDSLIEAKQEMADKLREYRKSLISEAVTGKFKVPGV